MQAPIALGFNGNEPVQPEQTPHDARETYHKPDRRVIAVLDAGGTITAVKQRGDISTTIRRPSATSSNRDVLDRALQHLPGVMRHYYGWHLQLPADDRPVKLERIYSEEKPILSEDATPANWSSLVARLARYCLIDRRLDENELLGIIVTHGTDTMPQAVAALTFAIQEQHIPIVFVGANTPLFEHRTGRLAKSDGTTPLVRLHSDGWVNLINAVGYCQLWRMLDQTGVAPSVLLSFAGNIHFPLNLRKFPSDMVGGINGANGAPSEAFVFENLLSRGRYLFSAVEGNFLYCNNWPPPVRSLVRTSSTTPAHLVSLDEQAYHQSFGRVAEVSAAISPPLSSLDHIADENVRVVLMRTYDSGAFPTAVGHHLREMFKTFALRNIPVFLCANYGMHVDHKYAVQLPRFFVTREPLSGNREAKKEMVVIRLGNVVPETALPLLYRACDLVDPNVFGRDIKAQVVADHLIEEIQKIGRSACERLPQLQKDKIVLKKLEGLKGKSEK